MPLIRIPCSHAGCLGFLSPDAGVSPGRYASRCPQGHRVWVVKNYRGGFAALPRAHGESADFDDAIGESHP